MKLIPLRPIYDMTGCISGLGRPSKMPCPSYSLPASACKVGQRLAKVPGSTCSHCYADGRGNYRFANVQATLWRRLHSIAHPLWAGAMARLVESECAAMGVSVFRWHDSGDIQSAEHLAKICDVAERTPLITHWLPTREYAVVAQYARAHHIPANLTIRVSAPMIDGPAPRIATMDGETLPISRVHSGAPPADAYVCPAPQQGNQCRDCRACWDKRVATVSYHQH